ncbi:uncharacterized protein LOC110660337 [Hevea brasiliensis]|uniref:uncharacterized protein LOC110660337 n=1 Tax=Hevea brasiliensis TaxID=3981 RepID=UPI0025F85B1C|nr:uncharacterized protein LOC110660337 [Hevea brasiliensis]
MISQLASKVDQMATYNKMLENQIAQRASSLNNKAFGKLPSQPENSREHCKAVTLRSGKILESGDKNIEEKVEGDEKVEVEVRVEVERKSEEEEPKYVAHKAYMPPLPFPQRFQKAKLDKQFEKFLEILSNKKKLEEFETVALTEESSAILQNKHPPKLKDPSNFSIPCHIGDIRIDKALCDLEASVSLMPLSIYEKMKIREMKPTTISLQLVDRFIKFPIGVIENVPLKVGKSLILVDFVVLEMKEDVHIPIVLGRPFLVTAGAMIDVKNGRLTLECWKIRDLKQDATSPPMFEGSEAPKVELKPLPKNLRIKEALISAPIM